MKRRVFLRGVLTAGAAACAGTMVPRMVLAAAWPASAFDADTVGVAMKSLFGGATPATSSNVTIEAPTIADNGASVPVKVSTTLTGVQSISVLASKNPHPLSATYTFSENVEPDIAMRLKMGKTADVIAVVKANGKLYSHKKQVKVTIGGCGG
ncbi:MAG: thiosulfate oxidation carrier protein SoxY [Chromatiales bacterium 21-64-14]|nr:MAG: thiosulfate oxidation carrier protein SoxY [Chromatiales bacterium 21-64-14]HQU16015.1 thiosulfate oxidation carrier protein SoxY [Gammaproteobacteria bacterium]